MKPRKNAKLVTSHPPCVSSVRFRLCSLAACAQPAKSSSQRPRKQARPINPLGCRPDTSCSQISAKQRALEQQQQKQLQQQQQLQQQKQEAETEAIDRQLPSRRAKQLGWIGGATRKAVQEEDFVEWDRMEVEPQPRPKKRKTAAPPKAATRVKKDSVVVDEEIFAMDEGAGEADVVADDEPLPCLGGCGFFGIAATGYFCSRCPPLSPRGRGHSQNTCSCRECRGCPLMRCVSQLCPDRGGGCRAGEVQGRLWVPCQRRHWILLGMLISVRSMSCACAGILLTGVVSADVLEEAKGGAGGSCVQEKVKTGSLLHRGK